MSGSRIFRHSTQPRRGKLPLSVGAPADSWISEPGSLGRSVIVPPDNISSESQKLRSWGLASKLASVSKKTQTY